MSGYVVSKGGTFGTVSRQYVTEDGVPMVVICWGPLGWITPVREDECKQLRSGYQSEAQAEAAAWLATLADERSEP